MCFEYKSQLVAGSWHHSCQVLVHHLKMQLSFALFLYFLFGIWFVAVRASKSQGVPIMAAVNTDYNLNIRNVETQQQPIKPQKIDIESNTLPLVKTLLK